MGPNMVECKQTRPSGAVRMKNQPALLSRGENNGEARSASKKYQRGFVFDEAEGKRGIPRPSGRIRGSSEPLAQAKQAHRFSAISSRTQ